MWDIFELILEYNPKYLLKKNTFSSSYYIPCCVAWWGTDHIVSLEEKCHNSKNAIYGFCNGVGYQATNSNLF
jgi:hypothetical protein